MGKLPKTEFINSKEGRTSRPKEQDIKPKAFRLPPMQMILYGELSERYILWMFAFYPYLYNGFFISDFALMYTGDKISDPNLPFNKGLQIIRT